MARCRVWQICHTLHSYTQTLGVGVDSTNNNYILTDKHLVKTNSATTLLWSRVIPNASTNANLVVYQDNIYLNASAVVHAI